MGYNEKTKMFAFSAIVALVALLIVIINAHTLFPQFLFHSIVVILIGIIVVLVAYVFLWNPCTSYVSQWSRMRKLNRLSRKHFEEFNDFVQRFASFPEFKNPAQGITGVLYDLLNKTIKAQRTIIQGRISDFATILRKPVTTGFSERLSKLHWKKKEINYEFLSWLAKEFEYYVALHKWLYVDFSVIKAQEIGLDKISTTKRLYSEYKGDYNDFIVAYTQFAGRSAKEDLRIFSKSLEKANEL